MPTSLEASKPGFNSANSALVKPIFGGYFCMFIRGFTDFGNLLEAELTSPMLLSFFSSVTVYFVFAVVGMRSLAQMIGVNAYRVITRMKNKIGALERAFVQFVGVTMRPDFFVTWQRENSISRIIFATTPKPARVSFKDAVFKSLFWLHSFKPVQITAFPILRVMFFAKASGDRNTFTKQAVCQLFPFITHGKISFKNKGYAKHMEVSIAL